MLTYINRKISGPIEVSFFVPCLNEAGNVGPTLKNIQAAANSCKLNFEILVFNDASTDATAQEVIEFAKNNPSTPIKLVSNNLRRGLARNYIDGAFVGEGEYYMLVNGDNAEPFETIVTILQGKGKADMVIPIFESLDNRTVFRKKLSRVFTTIVNFLSGNQIGYYNGPVLHFRYNVMRWHPDTDGFAYQAEIITRLIQEGASYTEVTVPNSDRVLGSSSALNIKNLMAVSHSLVQIGLRRMRWSIYKKDYKKEFMAEYQQLNKKGS